jgi:hypothetical protein
MKRVMWRPWAWGLAVFAGLFPPDARAAGEDGIAAITHPAERVRALAEYERRFPDGEEPLRTLLGLANDREQPDIVRGEALKAYTRMAKRLNLVDAALVAIKAQQGALPGLANPTWDALALLGPAALPTLMEGLPLCSSKYAAETGMDDHVFRATTVKLVVTSDPVAAQSASMELAKGLRCRHPLARRAYAQALSALPTLPGTTLLRIRRFMLGDARPETRSLAAAILAERQDTSSGSLRALERALRDRAELVRLSAAKALWSLGKKEKATPVLEKISRSRDPQLAQRAFQLLATVPETDRDDSRSE